MTLEIGTKLGAFEIVAHLGAGGMGEVYLARDTRLDRQVAIKVLPQNMIRDPERIERFEREAKLLAALNHPNIAAIYGFEKSGETRFLVMEYVDGETLAQRLERGAMELGEALHVAKQLAEALESAHENGVVHRDLKPANVMIRDDQSIRILDFGLAKAIDKEVPSEASPDSPTITAHYTKPGVLLGTAAYMSPEQARGQQLDKRTDIWSFGVICFECLSGRPLYRGETVSDSIGAIMHQDPDWNHIPRGTPPPVRLLLRRCLAKDRRRRLQAIGDARVELEDLNGAADWSTLMDSPQPASRGVVAMLPWVFCAVLAIVAAIAVTRTVTPVVIESGHARSSMISLPSDSAINWHGTEDTWGKIGFSRLLVASLDGRQIIFTVQEGRFTSLYLKEADEFAPRKIEGGKGARGAFLSPDGKWVGYLAEDSLRKVRLPGGAAQDLCEVNTAAFDATWLEDGTIVYATDLGLWRVSEDGGTSTKITTVDFESGARGHRFPQKIVGYPYVLFTVSTGQTQDTALLSIDTGEWEIIKKQSVDARCVDNRYLVFARDGEIYASPFDPANPTMVGTEEPIARGVHTIPGQGGSVVHLFATSQNGMLAYVPKTGTKENDSLVWVDQHGSESEIVQGSGYWMHQRLSPDGQRILFNRLTDDGMLDLYIYDIQRRQTSTLTRIGHAYDAEWSPDGKTVGYAALDRNGRSIYLIPTDFSGPARKIVAGSDARPHFCQWTHDGSTLVFFDRSSLGGIWTATVNGEGKLEELINTDLGEGWARVSPDGSLIAYLGREAGQRNIYVQAYPNLGPRLRVSRAGGGEPRWARDSRTLFYREAQKMYKAVVEVDPTLDVKSVEALPFVDDYEFAASGHQHYDLSADGQSFLMIKHGRRTYPSTVHVIDDWMSIWEAGSAP